MAIEWCRVCGAQGATQPPRTFEAGVQDERQRVLRILDEAVKAGAASPVSGELLDYALGLLEGLRIRVEGG